jgi:hypothetical protein
LIAAAKSEERNDSNLAARGALVAALPTPPEKTVSIAHLRGSTPRTRTPGSPNVQLASDFNDHSADAERRAASDNYAQRIRNSNDGGL